MTLIHGTGIFFEGKGIFFTGPSGSGKSDLALRVMALGAELIGDDYLVVTSAGNDRLKMKAAENIAGKIEVHNVGILDVPYRCEAEIDLVLGLVRRGDIQRLKRLPEPKMILFEGVNIPCLDFYPFEASAPEKLRAALNIML